MGDVFDNVVFAIVVTITLTLACKNGWPLWRTSILSGIVSASLSCVSTYYTSEHSKVYLNHVVAFEFTAVFFIGFGVVSSALYVVRKFHV